MSISKNVVVVSTYNMFKVFHTAITYFHCVSVKKFVKSIRLRNCLPMFNLKFLVYGGLYQITGLFLLCLSGYVSWSWGALVEANISCALNLCCFRVFSYSGAAESNVSRSHDSLDILWLIEASSCFMIDGGWLEWR